MMKRKLNLKRMALFSLLSMFVIGTFLIVSCNKDKEETSKKQTEGLIKKSAQGGSFDFPDGKYTIVVKGKTLILYIINGEIVETIDEDTGEIISPDKVEHKIFPGTKEGEDAAMKFIDSINDQYDCITMQKRDVSDGWVWLVVYGCD